MSKAKSGDSVKIHYTGTLDDGSEFDSSKGKEPLQFQLGSGQVIPGFDNAVDGMSVGDAKKVRLEPDDAYGEHHEQLVQTVPKTVLPDDLSIELGMQLQTQDPDGQIMNLTVTEIGDETITVDANHALAGQALTFDIELVEIDGSSAN